MGGISTGKTIEEIDRNIREAIKAFEDLAGFGEPIPRPTSVAEAVEVSAGRQPGLNLTALNSARELP